jgi:osmotically-inducible protein OsmY
MDRMRLSRISDSAQQIACGALSEAEALARLSRVLRSSSYGPIRMVACSLDNGIATLHGRVPTFFYKQMAQALAKSVPEVSTVDNCIEVVPRR